MENETLSKKDLIAPIISIVAFLLLVGGASYAYYSIGTISNSNVLVYGNIQLPARCIAATSKNDCVVTTPTLAQLTPGTASNSTAIQTNATCRVLVTVNGNQNCTCTYNVTVGPNTTAQWVAANYIASSISYKITGNASVAETFIPVGWSTASTVASGQTITIDTTGTGISKSYNMTVNFYNRIAVQDNMSGKSYKIDFKTDTPSCSIPTA